MKTRIKLFVKGRATFSFDAPSITHTPKRASIDVRVPPPIPAMSRGLLKRNFVDLGHWEGEDSVGYEPQEPPNAVSQAAKRRHAQPTKGQPGDDVNKRRHSDPGTLMSASKEGINKKWASTLTLELQSKSMIVGKEPLFPLTSGPCLPCDVLTRAELRAETAILAASLEAQLQKASKEAEAQDSRGPDGALPTSSEYFKKAPNTSVTTETPADVGVSKNRRPQFGDPTRVPSTIYFGNAWTFKCCARMVDTAYN